MNSPTFLIATVVANFIMKKLYIIGNGFDLHHKMKTQYSDFKEFVADENYALFEDLEKYFGGDSFWSDFENTLAYLETDEMVDEASNYLNSYGSDDWSESDNYTYQNELEKLVSIVTDDLQESFTKWILNIEITNRKIVNIYPDSTFLTFNYTNTLEGTYQIQSDNILYLHNKAVDDNSLLVIGHSRIFENSETLSATNDGDSDPRVAEGNEILHRYFKDTYKNTHEIIDNNKDFFDCLNEIDEIYILGHSMSDVDWKYFHEIKKNVSQDTNRIISYRNEDEIETKITRLESLYIPRDKIAVKKMNEL